MPTHIPKIQNMPGTTEQSLHRMVQGLNGGADDVEFGRGSERALGTAMEMESRRQELDQIEKMAMDAMEEI